MKDIFKKIDFLQPEVDIEHEGESLAESIFTLVISIIAIALMIYSIIYFFMPIFKKEGPSTSIYHGYIVQEGSYELSYSGFPHYLYMNDYNTSDLLLGFDFTSFRVIGIEVSLNEYTHLYEKDITKLDHWLYGNCEPDKYNFTKFDWESKIINESACIQRYYNHYDKKYYYLTDPQFKWPHVTYGDLAGKNDIYTLFIEKCQENTLHELFGNDIHCKSDSDIRINIDYGIWVRLIFYDNYINLLDYKQPNNSFLDYLEYSINNNFITINNVHYSPVTFNSDDGLFFEHSTSISLYQYEDNELFVQNNNMDDNIYLSYNINFNNKMSFYERTYSKILDVLSDLGGIIEIITFIAEFIVKYYNEYIVLKNTKRIICALHNKPNIGKTEKMMNNQNGEFYEIDVNKEKTNENNESLNNLSQNVENKENTVTIINKDETKNIRDIKNMYQPSMIMEGDQKDNEGKMDTENEEDKSLFTEENLKFNLFTYLLHKITLEKTFTHYSIYNDFRDKILCDEQFIKNHISVFNLKNKNTASPQIFSLKEIINDD